MKIEIDRRDVCNLMLACTWCHIASEGSKHWKALHDKLEKQLIEYDAKHAKEELK